MWLGTTRRILKKKFTAKWKTKQKMCETPFQRVAMNSSTGSGNITMGSPDQN